MQDYSKPLIGSHIRPIQSPRIQWHRVTFKVIQLLQAFSSMISNLCSWQDFNWHSVSRSPSATGEPLVTLITSVQRNLAKGRIAILSPIEVANAFVHNAQCSHVYVHYDWPAHAPPQKCPIPILDMHVVPWIHVSQPTKRHLDRFSCFCTAHPCPTQRHTGRQAGRHTDHDICSNRPHLCSTAHAPLGDAA